MSKLIPPLVSTTPPPIGIADIDDNDDDEFGDFTAAEDTTYGCDSFSIPNTPEDSPKKMTQNITTNEQNFMFESDIQKQEKQKDFQDKRKGPEILETFQLNGITSPTVPINDLELNGYGPTYNGTSINCENEDKMQEPEEIGIDTPPQLFDDDNDTEKEEISETPSNFSISFDDNVIDDDEEDSSAGNNLELPNHIDLTQIDEMKMYDDIESEVVHEHNEIIKENEEENSEKSIEKSSENDNFVDAEDDNDDEFGEFNDNCATIPEVLTDMKNLDNFTEFNAFASNGSQTEIKNEFLNENEERQTDSAAVNDKEEVIELNSELDINTENLNITEIENENSINKEEEEVDEFDDFADFSSAPFESVAAPSLQLPKLPVASQTKEIHLKETHITNDQEIDENNFQPVEESQEDDDDFGDFGDYTTTSESTTAITVIVDANIQLLSQENAFDEAASIFKHMFDSFAKDEEEEKRELDYQYCDYTQSDELFREIKDVTDTNALSYQWAKSQVQQGLLKALNIDTRNILYANGMPMPKFAANLSMAPLEPVKSDILMPTPVTSAQVSTNPSTEIQNPAQLRPINSGDIPIAQFDWSESGLANPLDSNQSTLFDLEQLTASLSLPITSITGPCESYDKEIVKESNLALEDWDLWLQSVSKEEPKQQKTAPDETAKLSYNPSYDTESVNSLQFPELSTDIEEAPKVEATLETSNDDFSDFTSFQSTSVPQLDTMVAGWTPNMIPLRETYIDDVKTDWEPKPVAIVNNAPKMEEKQDREEPGWFKPTILTPVLSHKEMTLTPQSDNIEEVDVDDEFTDFQDFQTTTSSAPATVPISEVPKQTSQSLQMHSETNMNAFGGNLLAPTVLQPTLLEPVKLSQPNSQAQIPQEILWPDPGITDEELDRFDLYAKKDGKYSTPTIAKTKNESASAKPSSVSNVNASKSSKAYEVRKPHETKLSGLAGSLMVEKSVVVPASKVILPFNEVILPPNNQVVISKDLVLPILEGSPRKYTPQRSSSSVSRVESEDDWSDFVSSSQPHLAVSATSPNLSNNLLMSPSKDRTSTPELSLSIPQLSSIQPSKPPIPVITPRGLMQTKIPMTPHTPTKSQQQAPLHVNPPTDGYQPAIISNQFAAQMNQSTFSEFLHNSHYQTTNIPANSMGKPLGIAQNQARQARLNGFHEDDEWSDFMSSQPQPINAHTFTNSDKNQTSLFNISAGSAMSMDWNRNNGPDIPNIITNPVHFSRYSVNAPPTKKPNGILNSKKQQNLNVARLPDLEFVAPKNKYHNKK